MENILLRNNVKVYGKGNRTIIFGHGFGCDQNMWRLVAPAFADDYKIVLFDYVGCGKSQLSAFDADRYSSLNGYAQDVLEICQTLHLRDVIFVGHSVSSMIGILAANSRPELFTNLILIGPSPRYINDSNYEGGFEHQDIIGLLNSMKDDFSGWANFLAPIIMKNPDRPELTEELEGSFCSTDQRMARNFAEVTFLSDNRRDLQKLKASTLILQCSDDAIAPDVVGEYVHRTIPQSKFIKLQATGHCPHMSHPAETIKVIQNYLKEAV